MTQLFRFLFLVTLIVVISESVMAQATTSGANTITTAVPFLTITPDSRAGGMGDAGVGLTPDVSSQHWNPAKHVFMESDMELAFHILPGCAIWLTILTLPIYRGIKNWMIYRQSVLLCVIFHWEILFSQVSLAKYRDNKVQTNLPSTLVIHDCCRCFFGCSRITLHPF
jgi:hypothetical protein